MRSGSGRSIAVALAAAVLSTTAFAGFKSGQNVVISTGSRFANGDAGYVYRSDDTVQYIVCRASNSTGSCYARNRDGVTRSCSTTSSTLLANIRSMNGDSYIYFKWDEDGTCTTVTVENGSTTRPKS